MKVHSMETAKAAAAAASAAHFHERASLGQRGNQKDRGEREGGGRNWPNHAMSSTAFASTQNLSPLSLSLLFSFFQGLGVSLKFLQQKHFIFPMFFWTCCTYTVHIVDRKKCYLKAKDSGLKGSFLLFLLPLLLLFLFLFHFTSVHPPTVRKWQNAFILFLSLFFPTHM